MQRSKWRERIKQAKYFDYVVLLASFVILQGLLALITRPNHSFKNLRWYYDVAQQIHTSGLFAIWTPYPPLFALFLYMLSILSGWESFFVFYKTLNVALVLAIGFLIYRIVQRYNPQTAVASALGYLLINATTRSAITIGYYFDQFDYIPLLMMMACLYMLMNGRILGSALLCGIGTMTKFFPIIALPVAVLTLDKRKMVWYVLFFAFACLIAVLPWLVANETALRSFYKFTISRDAWETIWSFPDISVPPTPPPKSLTVPFDCDANPYPSLTWLTVASVLGCLWWHKGRTAERAVPRMFLSLVLVFLIFSKGISSYYIFWIFPLLFVIYKPIHAFAACAALMLVGNIEFAGGTVWPLTYWLAIFGRHAVFTGLLVKSLFDGPSGWVTPFTRISTPPIADHQKGAMSHTS